MSNKLINNINHSECFKLKDAITHKKGEINKLMLTEEKSVAVVIVAINAGECVDTHSTTAEVFVYIIDGEGEFTINDTPFILKAGESIVMPADAPHSVKGVTDLKFMATKVFKD